jgi:hypothetical protein
MEVGAAVGTFEFVFSGFGVNTGWHGDFLS